MGLFCPFFGPAKAFTNVKDTGHDIIRRPFYFCFKPAQCQSGSHWGNFLGNLFLSSKEGMSAEISFLRQEKKTNFALLSQKEKSTDEKYLYDTDMREGKSKTLPRPRLTEVTALLGRPAAAAGVGACTTVCTCAVSRRLLIPVLTVRFLCHRMSPLDLSTFPLAREGGRPLI